MRGGGWTSEIHDFFKIQEGKKGAHRQDLKGLPNPVSKSHPAWNALLMVVALQVSASTVPAEGTPSDCSKPLPVPSNHALF